MTAINVVCLPQSVHLFHDTAASYEGKIRGHAVKCIPLSHINVAIAVRGKAAAIYALVRMATGYANYGHLRSAFAADLNAMKSGGIGAHQDIEALQDDMDVFVIGMGQSGPGAFMFFSHDQHGEASWRAIDIPYIVTTPIIPPTAFQQLSYARDPLGAVREVMQIQCDSNPGIVGGRLCETIVSAEGITMRTHGDLVRWRPQSPVMLPLAFARHLPASAS